MSLSPDGNLRFLPKCVSHNCFRVQARQEHVVNGWDADVTILLAWVLAWLTLQIEFGEVSPSVRLLDFTFTVWGEAWEVQAEISGPGPGQPGSHSDSSHPTFFPLASRGLPPLPDGRRQPCGQWVPACRSIVSHSVKETVSFLIWHLQT